MSTQKEIEIKFVVTEVDTLSRKLEASGFYLATSRTHEMNVLYDSPDDSLRKRGELLRLRKYGQEWKLTHKCRSEGGKHKTREETESSVGDGEKMEAILAKLGLQQQFRYEKFRTEWTDGQGEVVIDETPIGNFAEIEGAPEWIDKTAESLGVAQRDYITQSYAELFDMWRRKANSQAGNMTFQECGKSS